jgi:twitching motility protein PilT
MTIQELLQFAIERKASDLHIVAEFPPTLRINRDMMQMNNYPVISANDAKEMLLSLLKPTQKEKLMQSFELDCSLTTESGERFRGNFYFQRGTIAASFRHIVNTIRTVEELMLPSIFHRFIEHPFGLVLFTGPTGEGKSTSLASLIQEINDKYSKHIITIEDPIEYIFKPNKSLVSQRELNLDTSTWANALKASLRQDPDVILVGEMRDFETISAALTAAETGHLVFSTLHTSSTTEAINRIIDVFPPHQQPQIRSQLGAMLRVIVTQRLVATTTPKTPVVPAVEILQSTPAVATLIREGKSFMIDSLLETGDEHGMILMEKYLTKLFRDGIITKETALQNSLRPQLLMKYIGM